MRGRLQIWDLHRGGHNTFLAEAELREAIVQALKETEPSLSELPADNFEVHDLAFVSSQVDETSSTLLILTSLSTRAASHFAIVRVKLSQDSLEIGMVRHLKSYTDLIRRSALSKPRLHLPAPGHIAFAVFDHAVVVVSTAQQSASPGMQLLGEGHMLPDHYEDVIDFRRDMGSEIVGSGAEDPMLTPPTLDDAKSRKHRAKNAALLLLVGGVGVMRVTALDNKLKNHNPPVVSAKSKMEQAVFFGTQDNNPLSFQGREEMQFSREELQTAALALSKEIATSASDYIPSTAISVEQHLRQRQTALMELARHLARTKAPLDRRTRWALLAMAEKVAAASKCWGSYDAQLRSKSAGQKPSILYDIVLYIHERYKTEPFEEVGEVDRVRHWFIHDVDHIEVAIAWAWQVVKIGYAENDHDMGTMINMSSEAVDFTLGSLKTAFKFREEHLMQYGLEDEDVRNGILFSVDSYKDLPAFWTSPEFLTKSVRPLCDLVLNIAHDHWQSEEEGVDINVVRKLRMEAPEMVDINTISVTERYRWMLARDDEEDRETVEQGKLVLNASVQVREQQITKVADLMLVEEAIKVAEKHRVFSTLASLLIDELVDLGLRVEYLDNGGFLEAEDRESLLAQIQTIETRTSEYINRYREDFTNAMYRCYLGKGELHALVSDTTGKNAYLSDFLRSRPELSRLTWINEVHASKDFDRASDVLLRLAHDEERDAWSKKVQLSIGKLARLTGRNYSQKEGLIIPDGGSADLVPTNKELAVLGLQEMASRYIGPVIAGAIDEKAELELAGQVFGNKSLGEGLADLLAERLLQLISHKAMSAFELIDLLTLINTRRQGGEEHIGLGYFGGQEFYMALQALQSGDLDREERDRQQKIIWRRCILHDDWEKLNDTTDKNDRDVKERLQNTALYSTLRACMKNRRFANNIMTSPLTLCRFL